MVKGDGQRCSRSRVTDDAAAGLSSVRFGGSMGMAGKVGSGETGMKGRSSAILFALTALSFISTGLVANVAATRPQLPAVGIRANRNGGSNGS